MKLTLLCFFLCFHLCVFAQIPGNTKPIDIALITDSILLRDNYDFYIDSLNKIDEDKMPANGWRLMDKYDVHTFTSLRWLTHRIFVRFTLTNSSDSLQKVFFIGGTYISRIRFFEDDPSKNLLPISNQSNSDGFQPFTLQPNEQHTYIAAFYFAKKTHNLFIPQLIKSQYLNRYKKFHYYRNDAQQPVGFLLSGILLMMILFTGANYLLSRKKEFLYNCFYSFCMFGLIFLTTFLERKSGIFSSLFREYFDFVFLTAGMIFYIAFTRKFLDTDIKYPRLNKFFLYHERFFLILLCTFTILVFFTDYFFLQELLENLMKVLALIVGIVYIVIALRQKNKLMNYLAVGNAILIAFSIVSYVLVLFPHSGNSIFASSMLYYEIGIVSELISFLLGLTYKNRVELVEKTMEQEALKRAAEKRDFETKLAVIQAQQDERNRISADMHDDLGAGVTAIRLYSELAKRKIVNDNIPEIDRISSSANELLNNMNAIIWTMSSKNDTLDNLVAYIRSYALEYFEPTGINCYTHVDEDLPNVAVSGDIRRNIFLVVKEALNNILKHAEATEVFISLKSVPGGLNFYIQDNGKGIDLSNLRRFGNGLKNMKKRMEGFHITFDIENNNGTLITLTYSFVDADIPGSQNHT